MIIAYTALHYGSPYLASAIASVIDHVDKYYVLYSPNGSHGTRSKLALPESDSRASLQSIAQLAAGDKLTWIDGVWKHEGQQRDAIHTICPEADAVLVLDYDEIWGADLVHNAIHDYALKSDRKHFRFPMVHFWRGFHRAVLHDPALPVRIITKDGEGYATSMTTKTTGNICHMGYAIPSWLVRYKMMIHGHKAELRKDVDWFRDRWMVNADLDCHPVGSEFWNPEIVSPDDYLPSFMQHHPYYNMRVIS